MNRPSERGTETNGSEEKRRGETRGITRKKTSKNSGTRNKLEKEKRPRGVLCDSGSGRKRRGMERNRGGPGNGKLKETSCTIISKKRKNVAAEHTCQWDKSLGGGGFQGKEGVPPKKKAI